MIDLFNIQASFYHAFYRQRVGFPFTEIRSIRHPEFFRSTGVNTFHFKIKIIGNLPVADNAHIAASVNGTGTYEYQIDQGGFASESNFSNLAPGLHTITVRDAEGCTYLTQEFTVIGYPHYFTPNGDGFHDTWNIWSLSEQEFSQIHIFDRYGKLIKVISPNGPGWDGTYNGEPLPSTDYWFTVDYGLPRPYKTFKAHFSLKR
ncbi:MAG: T9SS type B sorting domain-containing protein [Flavobacterium sp.]|nr:MAG: T9SS type B sorting domain-containing protein [Flavobacterium sp.]